MTEVGRCSLHVLGSIPDNPLRQDDEHFMRAALALLEPSTWATLASQFAAQARATSSAICGHVPNQANDIDARRHPPDFLGVA